MRRPASSMGVGLVVTVAFLVIALATAFVAVPAARLARPNKSMPRLARPKTGRFSSGARRCSVDMMAKVRQVTGADFEKELGEWDTPIILDVFAVWCGPCQLLAPEMEKVAAELEGKCRVLKLDSDEEPSIASALQVYGLPTVLYLNDGRIVCRTEGAVKAETILSVAMEKLFGEKQPDPADELFIADE